MEYSISLLYVAEKPLLYYNLEQESFKMSTNFLPRTNIQLLNDLSTEEHIWYKKSNISIYQTSAPHTSCVIVMIFVRLPL